MKQFSIILFLLVIFFSELCIADSTCVRICYNGETGFPDYTTVDKYIDRYDSAGRLIQQEEYTIENMSWNQQDTGFRLVTRTDYSYYPSGLIDTMLQTVINFNGPFYSRTNYYYDGFGNLSAKIRFGGNSFPLDSNERTSYLYDSIGRKVFERYDQFVNNQYYWTLNTYSWIYDSLDRITESHKINYYSTSPVDSLYELYSFSPTDKLLSKKELYYQTNIDSNYYEYQYDVNDSLTRYTEYLNSSGNTWVPFRRHEFTYTSNSSVRIFTDCPDTTCSDTMRRETITYNAAGQILSRVSDEYDGWGWWNTTGYVMNTYDSLGSLIDYYAASFGGGGCSYSEHTIYEFNTSRNLTHTNTITYHCNEYYSDCYYYNLGDDSMLVLVDYGDTICRNTFIPLLITVEGGTRPYQFNWSPGNFLSDSTIINPLILNIDSTISYQLLVTDSNGMTASDTISFYVQPDLFIPVNITSFGLPCENNSFQLVHDTLPLNYGAFWTTPGFATLYGDTILALDSGQYTLTVRDSNGCSYLYHSSANLFPQPVVSLGHDTTICLNDTLTLSGGNFTQYEWSTGGTNSSIEVYSPVQTSDTISLIVTDMNGCINSDTITVSYQICSGVEDIPQKIIVTIFPNQIRIELPQELSRAKFELTDISGRVLLTSIVHHVSTIDISHFSPGIYLYNLDDHYSGKVLRR